MEKVQTLADFLGTTDLEKPEGPVELFAIESLTAKEFAQKIIASPEYRGHLMRMILLDEVPPAVDCMLWHYAYGKPTERVEHTGKDGQPIETITEVRRVVVRAVDVDEAEDQRQRYTTH